jgi:hypothetical protein
MIDKRVLQLVVKRREVSGSFNCHGRIAVECLPWLARNCFLAHVPVAY